MIESEALTEIITKSYTDFHLVRSEVTLDGFTMRKIMPFLVKHIQKYHKDMKAYQLIEVLDNGISCMYDDKFNRTKNFDLPTMQMWLNKYRGGDNKKQGIYISSVHPYTEQDIKEILQMQEAYKNAKKSATKKTTNSTGEKLRQVLGNPIGGTIKVKINELKK